MWKVYTWQKRIYKKIFYKSEENYKVNKTTNKKH